MSSRDKVRRLESIHPKQARFEPRTVVYLKLPQVNPETGEPEIEVRAIPVNLAPVYRALREVEDQQPQAPVRETIVAAESAEGRALGLAKTEMVRMRDLADPTYEKAMGEYNRHSTWLLFSRAVDIPLFVADPKAPEGERPAQGDGERIRCLEEWGLSDSHALSALGQIRQAMAWNEEDRRAFFSDTSASSPTRMLTGPRA